MLRRTPVPKSRVRDPWEQWEILLQDIEMKCVEKELLVCCAPAPVPWSVPLRADGAPAPCRVPMLPSEDCSLGQMWEEGEMTEEARGRAYRERVCPQASAHGSSVLWLAADFCALSASEILCRGKLMQRWTTPQL